jgi:transaldolase
LLKVLYFLQAYFEDGLITDEFIDHAAVIATAKEFSNRTIGMVDFVSSRLEKKK